MSADLSLEEALQGCGLRVVSKRTIQSLWAGYGKAIEVSAKRVGEAGEEGGAGGGKGKRGRAGGRDAQDGVDLVVKQVSLPRDVGRDDDVGHQRKVRSYKVEACFYRHVAPVLLSLPPSSRPALASPLLVQEGEGSTLLVLQDLRPLYPHSRGSLDLDHSKAALTWLARLHASFWNRPLPEGLWEEGCYWQLHTRLEELEALRTKWPQLYHAAHQVDAMLRNSPHRTLLHGDAKSPNFLFTTPSSSSPAGGGGVECAGYDLQYTGGGHGMRDVAYLLCCSVHGQVLRRHEEQLLRHYYDTLMSLIPPQEAQGYDWENAQWMFEVALLDLVRFLEGWGFFGDADWGRKKARVTLDKILKQGS